MKKFITDSLKKVLGNRLLSKYLNPATSLSDNDPYRDICIQASKDDDQFKNFRRNSVYNEILEHISRQEGQEYLSIIQKNEEILTCMDQFRKNDKFGNPLTYNYPSIGFFSPTTLRYIKVLGDLKSLFGSLNNFNICEIGVGYGGLCRIITSYFNLASYSLVDIQPVLDLSRKYLEHYNIGPELHYKTMDELEKQEYDLLISNYAFTELRRSIQDIYLNKVILNSKTGYITYNEITPEEYNAYKKDELLEIIPTAKIIKENPQTHPNNCIIVWGHNEG